jgi:hypothetical protein
MEVDKGVLAALAAPVLAGAGWMVNKIWRGIGHRIANAEHAAAAASVAVEAVEARRREDVIALQKGFSEHIARDVDMHERLLEAMSDQTSKLGEIHVSLTRALGDRPTRDEVVRLIELHQAAR